MTLVGASANLVTVGAAENAGHKVSFVEFMKVGAPITFITIAISTGYCLTVYDALGLGHE
eukprot:CAMPEP_0172642448 /NCGR_PEP_ID=MMETSP1068-20121228/232246_1 /TAXON_ID=35684 /ORGANISM="Pseudopedinella elastica, Strain CCMP716" /LENGTH=59 /DNA_ID=CAMNT_0013456273 /DNA_START=8 /DNA_END=187 /DNA_ORIENTATION=+